MKPILYSEKEKEFKTNGLGRLSDAITCEVTEERNGAYELEMTYPIDGAHYEDIKQERIILAKPSDNRKKQPFRIYEISRPMGGKITVRAEHISYMMSDIPVMPFDAGDIGSALKGLNANAAEESQFTFETDKASTGTFSVTVPTAMRSLLAGQEGSILDAFGGGEWEFDGFKAKLWKNRGKDNGVTIRYGKNLTDLKQEESISNVYTGIVPYWKGSSGQNDKEEKVVTLPEKAVYAENAGKYAYHRTKAVDLSSGFQSEPTVEKLRTAAEYYIRNNSIGVPKVSLTVSFIALWQTEEYRNLTAIEHVNLCDTVHVEFPKLGVTATAKVIKTVYDVLTERYSSIEVGDTKQTLTDTIKYYTESAQEAATNDARTYTDQSQEESTAYTDKAKEDAYSYTDNAEQRITDNYHETIEQTMTDYYTKSEIDKSETEIKTTVEQGYRAYTDGELKDYYTRSEVDQTAGEIRTTIETNRTDTEDEFKNYYAKSEIDQQATSIRASIEESYQAYTDGKLTDYVKSSTFTQSADGFNAEIRKKVGSDEIIASINASAEEVKIDASRIRLTGKVIMDTLNGSNKLDVTSSTLHIYGDVHTDSRATVGTSNAYVLVSSDFSSSYRPDSSGTIDKYLLDEVQKRINAAVPSSVNYATNANYATSSGSANYSSSTGKLGNCTNIYTGHDSSQNKRWIGMTISGVTYFLWQGGDISTN